MSFVTIEKQLHIETANSIGVTGRINSIIADKAHSNIRALFAGVFNDKGLFELITDNNDKVKDALKRSEFNDFNEREVLVARITDQLGSAAELASKIGNAGINIHFIFTTIFDNEPAIIISTNDNLRALSLFN